jgi:O-antigen/teichoic acid export membrane protein
MAGHGLRERLISGGRAQIFGHAVRVVIQVGGVAIFTAVWGLHLYGEWLVLAAVPLFIAFSDLGFVTAAVNDMVMAVGRDDRARARAVLAAITRLLWWVAAAMAVVLPLATAIIPLTSLLNLSTIGEFTASWTILALAFDTLIFIYASLLYGGYACEGRYGDGALAIALIALFEFCALAVAVVAGGDPAVVATAMLGARALGTVAMYAVLRRRSPWLWEASERSPGLLRSLLSPALASGAFPVALGLNVQGMVLMIGIAAGPVSVAIFSTLRTLSRAVIQLVASVNAVVSPEISTAYAAGDAELLRMIHRRGCQVAVWSAAALVSVLAVFGPEILDFWTSGTIDTGGALLYMFLGLSVLSSFWYTSAAVLIATNRHQRIAIDYVIASLVTLPIGYVLLEAMGLEGPALALIGLEAWMTVAVLRRALPAAHDTLGGLLRAIRTPPLRVLGDLVGLQRKARSAAS